MFSNLFNFIRQLFSSKKPEPIPFLADWRLFLTENVNFYKVLSEADKKLFEQRIILFLNTTEIVGNGLEVTEEDGLLVAASAIIPVWKFPKWHYFNLQTVILLPSSFNYDIMTSQPDSYIEGMVGTGMMHGKMLLSRNALHYGFSNNKDKRNVGIHEFVHLIDMADGDCDGFPERLKEFSFSIPWLNLVREKISEIETKKSNINPYGATNNAEFFSVASEYFFERPKQLKHKHPKLYQALSDFYQQDLSNIAEAIIPRKKDPCPCGSGKRYKRCCLPAD
ncbi:zinc-dependent peptidase [Psychromonas sp. SP041]|uniref:M90 family metallopeptidase n=1 Tax=Psychromonas sp. SP041 TaxID=1365007 RepID=UPI0004031B8C|nr:zinc-dependent peptidase [Psychromonas sp. SP041]